MIRLNYLYLLYQNERTMVYLSKEVFISTIEAIRLQLHKDREHAEAVAKTFGIDECYVCSYDNSPLIKALVLLLQISFPKKDNFCEIEHYMFDMNFGKNGEQELVTVEDLWDRLTNEQYILSTMHYWNSEDKHLVSTHPLIDDQKKSFIM